MYHFSAAHSTMSVQTAIKGLFFLIVLASEIVYGTDDNSGSVTGVNVSTSGSASETLLKATAAFGEKLSEYLREGTALSERLRRLEADAQNKIGKNRHFLIMTKSHELLVRGIWLQKAIDSFYHGGLAKDQALDAIFHNNRRGDNNQVGEPLSDAKKQWVIELRKQLKNLQLRKDKVDQELQHLTQTINKVKEVETEDLLLAKMINEAIAMQEAAKILQPILSWGRKVNREKTKEPQAAMDRSLQALGQIIAQKPNVFSLLQNAQKLLYQASKLRICIENYKRMKSVEADKPREDLVEPIVREYNDFARKLDLLGDGANGPHRNLYGQFEMNEIDRKIVEKTTVMRDNRNEASEQEDFSSVLNADFWIFIRQLLNDYYQLSLPQMDEVKIRGAKGRHIVLSIGLIEYNYTQLYINTKRRKFRETLDEYTSETSLKKAAPISGIGMVSLQEADRVFFDMVQHGWDARSYDLRKKRFCGTFVWTFVCKLLNGKCPPKEAMPTNFLLLDAEMPIIKAVVEYRANVLPDRYNCELKTHEIELQFDVNEMEKNGIQLALPLIVEYSAVKYRWIFSPTPTFGNQEQAVEIFPGSSSSSSSTKAGVNRPAADETVRCFKANLPAYKCNGSKGFSYIQDLLVFDQARKYQLSKEKGGENMDTEEKVDLQKVARFYIKMAAGH